MASKDSKFTGDQWLQSADNEGEGSKATIAIGYYLKALLEKMDEQQ